MTVRETKKFGSVSKNVIKLSHKNRIHQQDTLTVSSLSLPPKTNKLTLTLTTTILNHIWKTRNKLKLDGTIISATNVITNIKNKLKNIMLTHYKHHAINNTLHEFRSNLYINNVMCMFTQNSVTIFTSIIFTAIFSTAFTNIFTSIFTIITIITSISISKENSCTTSVKMFHQCRICAFNTLKPQAEKPN